MSTTEAHGSSKSASRDLLMVSLSRYYSQKNNIVRVLPYLSCKSGVSLRLIDWFVTNYAKKHNIILTRQHQNNVTHFNVYLSYRAQLKAYSKQQFDPFRRRDRVEFFYDRTSSVETTVGQLNFFRWMLQNDVLDFVHDNSADIERDMLRAPSPKSDAPKKSSSSSSGKAVTLPKSEKVPRRSRTELSQCKATKNMTLLRGARTVQFD